MSNEKNFKYKIQFEGINILNIIKKSKYILNAGSCHYKNKHHFLFK